MFNLSKWLYKLGHDAARRSIIVELESQQRFHQMQGEIAHYRKKESGDFQPRMSAEEHATAYETITSLLTHIDPIGHPNLEDYFRKVN